MWFSSHFPEGRMGFTKQARVGEAEESCRVGDSTAAVQEGDA